MTHSSYDIRVSGSLKTEHLRQTLKQVMTSRNRRKKAAWSWGDEQKRALQSAKSQLASTDLLVHLKSVLQCFSPGMGVVLGHELEDRSMAYVHAHWHLLTHRLNGRFGSSLGVK